MLANKQELVLAHVVAQIAYKNCDDGYGFDKSMEQFYANSVWIALEWKQFCKELAMSAAELRKVIKELVTMDYIGVVKDEWGEVVYLTRKSVGLTEWKCDFWKEV